MNKFILLLLALAFTPSVQAGKIQRQGIKTAAECVSAGATAATCLPSDSQIYVEANGLNKTLNAAITAGDLSGGGGLSDWTINAQTGSTYTLALTDRVSQSKVVTFGSTAQTTVTVPPNSSVAFPVGSEIRMAQQGTGQVLVSAGGGVTVNSRSGYTAPMARYAVINLLKTATDAWTLFGELGSSLIVAGTPTGSPTITTNGDYDIYKYNGSGSFVISSGYGELEYLIISGGGAGGIDSGGGGAGGGVLCKTAGTGIIRGAGTYTVTVGAGGTSAGSNGVASVLDTVTVAVGGGGGDRNEAGANGANGGGGGAAYPSGGPFAGGTGSLGFAGGSGNTWNGSSMSAGGGGGMGAIGTDPSTPSTPGNGGIGITCAIENLGSCPAGGTAPNCYFGGGGGGGGTGAGGTGGSGGGGAGGASVGTNGTANTGGGGGGTGGATFGTGGSGRIVIKFKAR